MSLKSDNIHTLIKSLSKSEKRYFTRFAERQVVGKGNDYYQLFKAIDAQAEYDEANLKQKLAKSALSKHFAVSKYQLYQLILDSLSAFHATRSPEAKFHRYQEQIEILIQKNLPFQAQDLLLKAQKFSQKHQNPDWSLALLQSQKRLKTLRGLAKSQAQVLADIHQEEQSILKTFQLESDYWYLSIQLYQFLTRRGQSRNEADEQRLGALMANPLLSEPPAMQSFRARQYYWQSWGTYHFIQGNAEAAFDANQKRVELYHQYPIQLSQNVKSYVSALNNYLVDCLRLEKTDLFYSQLPQLRERMEQSTFRKIPMLQQNMFRLLTQLELNLLLQQKEYEIALNRLPEIETELELYRISLPLQDQITFHYLIFSLYYGAGAFRKAVSWMQALMGLDDQNTRQELMAASRLVYLLLQWDLDNHEILQTLMRSSKRYLKKQAIFDRWEQAFFRTLSRQLSAYNERERREYWLEFRNELLSFQSKDEVNTLFQYFDFIGWIDNKLDGEIKENA
ncbi:MAG: hypothetical protein AB8H47_20680 [Bacteroidia bacterium]